MILRSQWSDDDGITWNRVGNYGDLLHWYDCENIEGPMETKRKSKGTYEGWSGNAHSGWKRYMHVLDGLAGKSNVFLRFLFVSDEKVESDGFAFDDIRIFEGFPSKIINLYVEWLLIVFLLAPTSSIPCARTIFPAENSFGLSNEGFNLEWTMALDDRSEAIGVWGFYLNYGIHQFTLANMVDLGYSFQYATKKKVPGVYRWQAGEFHAYFNSQFH
jgi:hypothetical protein